MSYNLPGLDAFLKCQTERVNHALSAGWENPKVAIYSTLANVEPEGLAAAYVFTATIGDTAVLELIRIRLDGAQVRLEHRDGKSYCSSIHGETTLRAAAYRPFFTIDGPDAMETLCMIQQDTGVQILDEGPWSFLFRQAGDGFMQTYSVLNPEGLLLPHLRANKTIGNSELLRALKRRGKAPGASAEWFEDILCLADPEMIAESVGELLPYRTFFDCDGGNGMRPVASLCKESPAFRESGLNFEEWMLREFSQIDFFKIGLEPEGRSPDIIDKVLIDTFLTPAQRRGEQLVAQQAGAVLCRTKVQYLERFAADRPKKLKHVVEKVRLYAPLAILAAKSRDPKMKHFQNDAINQFHPWRTAAPTFMKELYEVSVGLRQENWLAFSLPSHFYETYQLAIQRQGQISEWQAHLLRNVIGTPNTEFLIQKYFQGPSQQDRQKSEMTFCPGTDLMFGNIPHTMACGMDEVDALLKRASGVLNIEGVSSDFSLPDLLALMVGMHQDGRVESRAAKAVVVGALMRSYGFDAVLPLLKAPEYWHAAYVVFGCEPLLPFVTNLPESLQTVMAADTFNL